MVAGSRPIRVLLVDLRPGVIRGLNDLVNAQRPKMEMVGHAGMYASALELASHLHPDVVLLSIFPDPLDVMKVVSVLTYRWGAQVLILKSEYESISVARAIEAGARGTVLRDGSPVQLVQAIVDAAQDRSLPVRTEGAMPRQAHEAERAKLAQLTLREKQVICAIAASPSAKYFSIADRLGISEHTVHNHLSKIYQKLDVTNRIDLLIYSLEHGLADDNEPASPALMKLHRTGRPNLPRAGRPAPNGEA